MKTAKAMISQPMGGKNGDEILAVRDKAKSYLESLGYEVVDTFFNEEWVKKNVTDDIKDHSLYYLARSLEVMSTVNLVYFCRNYEFNRGCRIEHQAAVDYGLIILYE